jgi:threonine dehydratase
VVAGVGGGGLLAGITLAVAHAGTGTRVVGVQAAGAAAWPASLDAGQPVAIDRMTTMADGIAVARPGEVPYSVVSPRVPTAAAVCTVDEDDVSQAVLLVLERAKLLVEPAGAVSVAALLARVAPFEPPVVAVLTGGNVDPLVLHRILRHGLAAAGRYLSVRVRIADRPGALSALLAAVAAADANLVEVEHRRVDPALHVDEVEVALQLETRGPQHRTDVLARLAAAGYRVIG